MENIPRSEFGWCCVHSFLTEGGVGGLCSGENFILPGIDIQWRTGCLILTK